MAEKFKNMIICSRRCLQIMIFVMVFCFCNFNILTAKADGDFHSDIKTVSYSKGFTSLFGEGNIKTSTDDHHYDTTSAVSLHLNQYTGSGFRSSDLYSHGFFSARIKLPSDYTAGVVVAFYTTNGDVFEKTHDELDFEFLGNIKGKAWRFQTNMYGNGSTSRGREERYHLWFDPSKEFHRYSILWTTKNIIFYIDDVPIREIRRNEEMGGDYPSKPMALYATIWDASDWATSGGKYKANYKYAPFIAEFTDLALQGCAVEDPMIQQVVSDKVDGQGRDQDCTIDQLETASFAKITNKQRTAMKKYRQRYMYYSYCYDSLRYPVPLPECVINDPSEKQLFKETGRLKFIDRRRRHSRHWKRSRTSRAFGIRNYYPDQDVVV